MTSKFQLPPTLEMLEKKIDLIEKFYKQNIVDSHEILSRAIKRQIDDHNRATVDYSNDIMKLFRNFATEIRNLCIIDETETESTDVTSVTTVYDGAPKFLTLRPISELMDAQNQPEEYSVASEPSSKIQKKHFIFKKASVESAKHIFDQSNTVSSSIAIDQVNETNGNPNSAEYQFCLDTSPAGCHLKAQVPTKKALDIEVIKPGDEKTYPKKGQKVSCHFVLKLLNGKKIDSSRDRKKQFVFTIGKGEVIKEWDDYIIKMSVGERSKLTIPPDMSSGSKQGPSIPAKSTLELDVELLKILN